LSDTSLSDGTTGSAACILITFQIGNISACANVEIDVAAHSRSTFNGNDFASVEVERGSIGSVLVAKLDRVHSAVDVENRGSARSDHGAVHVLGGHLVGSHGTGRRTIVDVVAWLVANSSESSSWGSSSRDDESTLTVSQSKSGDHRSENGFHCDRKGLRSEGNLN